MDTVQSDQVNDVKGDWKATKKRENLSETPYWRGKDSPMKGECSYYGHHWIDHPKTVRRKGSKRKLFIAEPYELNNDSILEMAALIKDGWHIHVDGRSPHYPGWTVRVIVMRSIEEMV